MDDYSEPMCINCKHERIIENNAGTLISICACLESEKYLKSTDSLWVCGHWEDEKEDWEEDDREDDEGNA